MSRPAQCGIADFVFSGVAQNTTGGPPIYLVTQGCGVPAVLSPEGLANPLGCCAQLIWSPGELPLVRV